MDGWTGGHIQGNHAALVTGMSSWLLEPSLHCAVRLVPAIDPPRSRRGSILSGKERREVVGCATYASYL